MISEPLSVRVGRLLEGRKPSPEMEAILTVLNNWQSEIEEEIRASDRMARDAHAGAFPQGNGR